MKRLIIFDLDGTLAESKSSLSSTMANLLTRLLGVAKVAVISGGAWPQFEKQLLPGLLKGARLDELFLLPTCGTRFYKHADTWTLVYANDFDQAEKSAIISALKAAMEQAGLTPNHAWGELIEDRGGQITFSALGQEAPLSEKRGWDPDFVKRRAMKELLDISIPGFSVTMGGATSLDVTRAGVDKAFGVEKLRETLSITFDEMLFVGDALFPGGNDSAVRRTGVDCIAVGSVVETERVIETLIACLTPGR